MLLGVKPNELQRLARVRDQCASGEAKRLREDAGLSLSEVASSVGVDTSSVWRWESALRRPRGPAALRYERLLQLLEDQETRRQEATA